MSRRCLGVLVGYLPGSLIGGEDLPGPAFLEWARWCMMPGFFFDDPTLGETANFAHFRAPVRFAQIEDDPWGTPAAVGDMASHFTASVDRSIWAVRLETLVARESGTPASSAASFATRFGRGRPIGWTARQLRVEHLGSFTVGVIGPRNDRIAEHARR